MLFWRHKKYPICRVSEQDRSKNTTKCFLQRKQAKSGIVDLQHQKEQSAKSGVFLLSTLIVI